MCVFVSEAKNISNKFWEWSCLCQIYRARKQLRILIATHRSVPCRTTGNRWLRLSYSAPVRHSQGRPALGVPNSRLENLDGTLHIVDFDASPATQSSVNLFFSFRHTHNRTPSRRRLPLHIKSRICDHRAIYTAALTAANKWDNRFLFLFGRWQQHLFRPVLYLNRVENVYWISVCVCRTTKIALLLVLCSVIPCALSLSASTLNTASAIFNNDLYTSTNNH